MEDIYIINNSKIVVKNGLLKSMADELINKKYAVNYKFFLINYDFELTKITRENKQLIFTFINKISDKSYKIIYSDCDYYEVYHHLSLHLTKHDNNIFNDTYEYKLLSIEKINDNIDYDKRFIIDCFKKSGFTVNHAKEIPSDFFIVYFLEIETMEIKTLITQTETAWGKYKDDIATCYLYE